jgi:hypothetical protein
MGKMASASAEGCGTGGVVQSELKSGQLSLGKRMKKGLEDNHSFTKAGIQIVMDGIEQFPVAVGTEGITTGQVFSGGLEGGIKLLHKIRQRGELMRELGLAGKQDPAEHIIEEGNTLATRMLEILRVQRSQIGSNPKMFCVLEHDP